jgi:hypothetical protein
LLLAVGFPKSMFFEGLRLSVAHELHSEAMSSPD